MTSNLSFPDLPNDNSYNDVTVDVSIASLQHLYIMTTSFVNLVFQPFSAIEEFIYTLITSSNNDFLSELLKNWQTSLPGRLFIGYKLASFEVGFMVCFVAGCLFIIFVPLVGSIMCCCRTCCDNCGGEMTQSKGRVQSKWKYCFGVSLFIITAFIAVPVVFVFLTNEWVTQVVKLIPQNSVKAFNDINSFVDLIPTQFNFIIAQYYKLESGLVTDVSNLGTAVGVPIRDTFIALATPSLTLLSGISLDAKNSLAQLEQVQSSTTEIQNGITSLDVQLTSLRNRMNSALNNSMCMSDVYCNNVLISIKDLTTGGDFAGLQDVQTQITEINNTLTLYDIDGEIANIWKQIYDIPDLITNSSTSVTTSLLDTLATVNETVNSAAGMLPLADLDNAKQTMNNFNQTIYRIATDYGNKYDIYRYAAGIVLGSILALICALYFVGMLCGSCAFKHDRNPAERSTVSNCGGLLIMAGVGFSFIFGWILMILVTLTFTVGGHGERYICQNLEYPYEGIKFADRIINATSPGIPALLRNPEADLSAYSIFTSCENNASIYKALQLEYVFNATQFVQNTTQTLDDFKTQLAGLTVNLSSLQAYTPEVEDALNSLKATGLDGIDFNSFLNATAEGLTKTNLTAYAQFLNNSAENSTVSSSIPQLVMAFEIMQFSYEVTIIQSTYVDPLTPALANLTVSITELQRVAMGLNTSVDATAAALQVLDAEIQTNGSVLVAADINKFADSLISTVLAYANWLLEQLNNQFGRCYPVYLAYSQAISILCSYLMDVLNGLWFCLGWITFFLIPGAIFGMKLAKYYRRLHNMEDYHDNSWNEMEMDAFNRSNNNGQQHRTSAKFRSAKIHPGEYY